MIYLSDSDADIAIAARGIREGRLAAFPTETVYGLGGNGYDSAALARIFEAKRRPRFDPLIIHIASLATLEVIADREQLLPESREKFRLLSRNLWPGPLTVIVPKKPCIPDLATSGLHTLAIRFPDHPVALKLIEGSTGAVAAPSANPFGYLSPTSAAHVREQLGDRVDFIIDGGSSRVGVESTVLDLCAPSPRILRPGGMSRETLEALIGPVTLGGGPEAQANPAAQAGSPEAGSFNSPGLLKSHYAPHTPLALHADSAMAALTPEAGAGYLFFSAASRERWIRERQADPARCWALSEKGESAEAASHLFELLHRLDTFGLRVIHAEAAPEGALGPAINDRLRRAASH